MPHWRAIAFSISLVIMVGSSGASAAASRTAHCATSATAFSGHAGRDTTGEIAEVVARAAEGSEPWSFSDPAELATTLGEGGREGGREGERKGRNVFVCVEGGRGEPGK